MRRVKDVRQVETQDDTKNGLFFFLLLLLLLRVKGGLKKVPLRPLPKNTHVKQVIIIKTIK